MLILWCFHCFWDKRKYILFCICFMCVLRKCMSLWAISSPVFATRCCCCVCVCVHINYLYILQKRPNPESYKICSPTYNCIISATAGWLIFKWDVHWRTCSSEKSVAWKSSKYITNPELGKKQRQRLLLLNDEAKPKMKSNNLKKKMY